MLHSILRSGLTPSASRGIAGNLRTQVLKVIFHRAPPLRALSIYASRQSLAMSVGGAFFMGRVPATTSLGETSCPPSQPGNSYLSDPVSTNILAGWWKRICYEGFRETGMLTTTLLLLKYSLNGIIT
jgi:hypothetical protein